MTTERAALLPSMPPRSFQPFICALLLLSWLLLFAGQFVTLVAFGFDSPWFSGNAAEFSLWSGLGELFWRHVDGLEDTWMGDT